MSNLYIGSNYERAEEIIRLVRLSANENLRHIAIGTRGYP